MNRELVIQNIKGALAKRVLSGDAAPDKTIIAIRVVGSW